MIISSIVLNKANVTFKLELRDRFIIVTGDSGKGKTLMYKAFKDKAGSDIESGILCFNYDDLSKNYRGEIENAYNKLIVIDNAELLLDSFMKINVSRDLSNQYIILTNNHTGYWALNKNLAELVIEDGIGRLNYF